MGLQPKSNSPLPKSGLRWIDAADNRVIDLPPTAMRASQRWNGAAVWVAKNETPGEKALGSFEKHLIAVNTPALVEFRWSGSPWRKYRIDPSAVQSLQAGHPFACAGQPNACVCVEIAPTFFTSSYGSRSSQAIELQPHYGLKDAFLVSIIHKLGDEARHGCPSGPIYGETLSALLAAHLVRYHSV